MPEVNGNDPSVRENPYVSLSPCSTRDPLDPAICHAYEARRVIHGERTGKLGWFTLEQARATFANEPYIVGRGSHGLCPPCFDRIMQQMGIEPEAC